jgi:hypothetical protein
MNRNDADLRAAAAERHQIDRADRMTEKGRPPADWDRPSIPLSPVKEEQHHDDS